MDDYKAIDILLVEDNPEDAELTLRELRKTKTVIHILVVNDGAEALDFFNASGKYINRNIDDVPKLVILDLKLPKVNGFEVLRIVKSNERTKSIPVVVLTSSLEESDTISSYKLGASSFIVKPLDFTKFSTTVQELGMNWYTFDETPK